MELGLETTSWYALYNCTAKTDPLSGNTMQLLATINSSSSSTINILVTSTHTHTPTRLTMLIEPATVAQRAEKLRALKSPQITKNKAKKKGKQWEDCQPKS